MGSGVSQYRTKQEALAAGITEEQIAEYMKSKEASQGVASSVELTKDENKAAKKQAKAEKKAAEKAAKKEKKEAKKAAKKVCNQQHPA